MREVLPSLCRGKRPDDFVFYNPATGDREEEVKTAFKNACAAAGIEGLQWKHLRATFGTRLGEGIRAGMEAA